MNADRRRFKIGVVAAIFFMCFICLSCGSPRPEDQRIVENEGFKLKITKSPAWLGLYKYSIESNHDDSIFWWNVHSWTQDDPWSVSEIDMKVMSPSTAYFFNTTEYGVTADRGQTWKFFGLYDAMANRDKIKHGNNHDWPRVSIEGDGTGSIYLQDYNNKSGDTRVIYRTADYGQTWSLATN